MEHHSVKSGWKRFDHSYMLMLSVYILFIIVALLADSLTAIVQGACGDNAG